MEKRTIEALEYIKATGGVTKRMFLADHDFVESRKPHAASHENEVGIALWDTLKRSGFITDDSNNQTVVLTDKGNQAIG